MSPVPGPDRGEQHRTLADASRWDAGPALGTIEVRPAATEGRDSFALIRAREAEFVLAEVVEDHLLGDGGDAHDADFAPVALDVEFAGVAEAAVGLEGAVGGFEAPFGGEVLGHVGLGAAGLAVVVEPG